MRYNINNSNLYTDNNNFGFNDMNINPMKNKSNYKNIDINPTNFSTIGFNNNSKNNNN